MKIETHGPLKLSVAENGVYVRIDVSRIRSAEDLMDSLELRAVYKYVSKSGHPNVILNLGSAGVVSAQMLEWLVRKWMPAAQSNGLRRLSVVTATEAHKMLASIFDACRRQVRAPLEIRFFTAAQLKTGSAVHDWFTAAPAETMVPQGLELAVHAFGGVPFVCVDFPYMSSIEEYKKALVDEEILNFIRANQGNNLLLNFTASTVFGNDLPLWIQETWLQVAANTGVRRVLIALPSQVHGSFSKVLKPATCKTGLGAAHVKYCGESEVFDTGEALNWFKDNQAA